MKVLIQVCDGNQDCRKGGDECLPRCIRSAFSNPKSMIKNKEIFLFVSLLGENAIIGIVFCNEITDTLHSGFIALVGNMTVIFRTTQLLIKSASDKNRRKGKHLNAILILNLSIADFLVAVSDLISFYSLLWHSQSPRPCASCVMMHMSASVSGIVGSVFIVCCTIYSRR